MTETDVEIYLRYRPTLKEGLGSILWVLEQEDDPDTQNTNVHEIPMQQIRYIERKYETFFRDLPDNLKTYLENSPRNPVFEFFVSTTGAGVGFFDHGTEEGEALQNVVEEKFKDLFYHVHAYRDSEKKITYLEGIPETRTLRQIAEEHPNLIFQNNGYEYIKKETLTPEDIEAFHEVETILKSRIKDFVEFFNFKRRKDGTLVARVDYKWDVSFCGVGYFPVDELDAKYDI